MGFIGLALCAATGFGALGDLVIAAMP